MSQTLQEKKSDKQGRNWEAGAPPREKNEEELRVRGGDNHSPKSQKKSVIGQYTKKKEPSAAKRWHERGRRIPKRGKKRSDDRIACHEELLMGRRSRTDLATEEAQGESSTKSVEVKEGSQCR